MKKLRILKGVLRRTGADKILLTYVIFLFCAAAVILLVEPEIDRYGTALWYCYAVLSTTGFGDVLVTTAVAKIISVLVTVYSTLVIAILTGVVVNFYTQIIHLRQKETLVSVMDRLEHLPELSKEELADIADIVRNHRLKD